MWGASAVFLNLLEKGGGREGNSRLVLIFLVTMYWKILASTLTENS